MSIQDSGPASRAREIHIVRFYDNRDGVQFDNDFRPTVLPADAEEVVVEVEEVPVPKVESAPGDVETPVKKSEDPASPAETPAKKVSSVKVPDPGKQGS